MQSTGESMGVGRTFAAAYWKALLGAGMKRLPFGRPVIISGLDGAVRGRLATLLGRVGSPIQSDAGCLDGIGLAVVLGRSPDDIALLRACVDAGVSYVSTPGGLRGLMLALAEASPDLAPIVSARTERGSIASAAS